MANPNNPINSESDPYAGIKDIPVYTGPLGTSSKESSDQESPPSSENINGGDTADDFEDEKPFVADDHSGVEPASIDEVNTINSRKDESDLEEDFPRYEKARSDDEKSIRQRLFEAEQKLHTVDLTARSRFRCWYSPFIDELHGLMAEHLGISKGQAIEAATLMFYRNCFSNEKRMLNDLGLMLDSFALQNQELGMEASAMEDLALMAIEAEASPARAEDFPELDRSSNEVGSLDPNYIPPDPPKRKKKMN